MRRLLSIALLTPIFLGPCLQAAPPLSVPAKVTGQPGSFVTVKADTPGKTVRWLVLDAGLNLFPIDLLKDTHTAVAVSSTPGTYRLLAVTAVADEVSAPAICQVVIEGAAPAPAPTPAPGPTPAPVPDPAGKVAWAIVIVDNNARTPQIGQLVSSPGLIATLRERGIGYRVFDVRDPLIQSLRYQPFLNEAGGAPALLLLSDTGKRLKAIRLPADAASFLAALAGPALATAPPCPT